MEVYYFMAFRIFFAETFRQWACSPQPVSAWGLRRQESIKKRNVATRLHHCLILCSLSVSWKYKKLPLSVLSFVLTSPILDLLLGSQLSPARPRKTFKKETRKRRMQSFLMRSNWFHNICDNWRHSVLLLEVLYVYVRPSARPEASSLLIFLSLDLSGL